MRENIRLSRELLTNLWLASSILCNKSNTSSCMYKLLIRNTRNDVLITLQKCNLSIIVMRTILWVDGAVFVLALFSPVRLDYGLLSSLSGILDGIYEMEGLLFYEIDEKIGGKEVLFLSSQEYRTQQVPEVTHTLQGHSVQPTALAILSSLLPDRNVGIGAESTGKCSQICKDPHDTPLYCSFTLDCHSS